MTFLTCKESLYSSKQTKILQFWLVIAKVTAQKVDLELYKLTFNRINFFSEQNYYKNEPFRTEENHQNQSFLKKAIPRNTL